ncbi:WecB/TagA/CpsF family glycosyltransferase [Chroococcidiopsis thermalis]|uniref:Glycosyl transferase, WecB/TagA/CpsF family n=1 Tax=Chroococcidiopsis thermalis (strain PCC 7203) TaxID=251229 RepID=K9TZ21_CHRTP|nr:WecB/TagA/CpsF family glycosyltransferase [Chroococcidiopsis thermalis]AFY87638.1 glycosyl transferase, WecB/TagA/CpsF family [Chroococcidiopsis thermalis PCC 7203]
MKNLFAESSSIQSLKLLGITVNALSMPQLNALIANAINLNKHWIIANHNMHSIYLYHHDAKMRAFYAKADYTHVDGMALVLMGQFLGLPLKREHRVTYADWIEPLITEAAYQGWRVFYLGSKPGVAEQGAKSLKDKFPNLQIATGDGYFDAQLNSSENCDRLATINAYQPHILMVGMSMPRQEHWILDNLEHLCVNVILPSGAAIDYIAGTVPTPPRWSGKWGLEWLFRLVAEPGRLWQRYLVEPWLLLKLLLSEGWIKLIGG